MIVKKCQVCGSPEISKVSKNISYCRECFLKRARYRMYLVEVLNKINKNGIAKYVAGQVKYSLNDWINIIVKYHLTNTKSGKSFLDMFDKK